MVGIRRQQVLDGCSLPLEDSGVKCPTIGMPVAGRCGEVGQAKRADLVPMAVAALCGAVEARVFGNSFCRGSFGFHGVCCVAGVRKGRQHSHGPCEGQRVRVVG